MSEKQKQLTKKHKLGNLLRRTFGNLLVTIMLAGFAFLVLLSLANEFSGQIGWLSAVTETSAFKWTKRFPDFLSSTTLLISFCNVVFPLLFSAIIRFERYTNPISEARIMLARTYLLKMSSLYIILVGYFYTNKEKTASSSVRWENELGKTFYQLVWADFVFSAIGTLLTGFGTRLIFGKSYYDFGISDNILELTYRQALIWVGTVFSPMIIIVSLFTGYLLFFVKKFVLVSCSMPPKRIYNSYTQSLYFLGFQLLTLGLMIFPVFYSLTRMAPTCGPFGPDPYPAGQGRYLDSAYDFIRLAIASIDLLFFREIINFMGTIGFVLPLVLCLTIYIYYLLAVSVKRLKRVRQLQYELNMERTDKKFLLRYYNVKT